jgi:protein-disulfide isomerase
MSQKNNDENVIVLDVQTLLVPAAIIIAGVIIAGTIFFTSGGRSVGGDKDSTGSNTAVTESELGPLYDLASIVDVTPSDLKECVDSGDFLAKVQKGISDGSAAGITGTPGFVIGKVDGDNVVGEVLSGAQPFEAFQEVIEKYLSGAGETVSTTPIDGDPVKGDTNKAKVAVVEFSDYECPFCQRFHQTTFDQLVEEYVDAGKVIYVYKDFPLSFHDPVATEEAMAAQCIYDMKGDDAFFTFASAIYEKTKTNGEGL